MSRKRRNFTSKFKSDLVIEVLKGERDLTTIATENDIQPNLLHNWKKEFLEKLPQFLTIPARIISKRSSLSSARKKPNTLRKLANSPCRWIG